MPPENRLGSIQLAITRAQYLTQELVRRSQDRQTRSIIAMTLAITIMTFIIMVATPEWSQAPVHAWQAIQSLLTHAWQAIGL